MEFGLMFSHRNPPQFAVPYPTLYAQTLEQVVVAEQLGFDAVLTTEHHFVEDGYSPSLMPIEAAWAARTKRVKLGSYVLLLPMQNPIRLAEDAATVDIISGGRLFLGMGLGYRRDEFVGFGLPPEELGGMMDEALEVLVRLWTEERFTFRGRHFNFENIGLHPKPVQQPRPPIWLGSPGSKAAVRRVAQWGLEGFCGSPAKPLWDHYVKKCEEYGTLPKAQTQVLAFGHVSDDPEKAWREAGPYAQHVHDYYVKWQRAAGNETVFADSPRNDFIFGDPAHWIQRLERVLEQQGGGKRPSTIVVQLQMAGMPHETALRSMELFAKKVMPHFKTR